MISGELIPIIAIGGGILVAIVAIISGTILSMYKVNRQANLKQMMLEAGMSPYDIERVLNAGTDDAVKKQPEGKQVY